MKNLREINCTSANIAVDIDGTIFEWADFPNIGKPVPHAFRVLQRLQERGHQIIIWSVRHGDALDLAINEIRRHGIIPWAVNINHGQDEYSLSPKIDCETYIDDKALGCPLWWPNDAYKPYVDWQVVEEILERFGWLEPEHSQADGYSI